MIRVEGIAAIGCRAAALDGGIFCASGWLGCDCNPMAIASPRAFTLSF